MLQKKDSQIQFETRNDIPVLTRQRQMLSSKDIQVLTLPERQEKIKKLLQNYQSLKKHSCIIADSLEGTRPPLPDGILSF
jgi:hypothetical protein